VLGAGGLAAAGGAVGLVDLVPSGDGEVTGAGDVVGSLGNSELSAWGRDGFGCLARGLVLGFDGVVVGKFSGRDSEGRGAVELEAAWGKDGSDGVGSGRPGNGIDDDDELVDIGSEGANAMNAGTPMSARPNVPAARDPTRRRKVRGIFPTNLLFRMAWLRPSRRLPRNARKHT
jgi:hypothetical protein